MTVLVPGQVLVLPVFFILILPGASISTSTCTNGRLVPVLVVMTLLACCDASVLQVQQDLSKQLLGRLEGNKAITWESGVAWGHPPQLCLGDAPLHWEAI